MREYLCHQHRPRQESYGFLFHIRAVIDPKLATCGCDSSLSIAAGQRSRLSARCRAPEDSPAQSGFLIRGKRLSFEWLFPVKLHDSYVWFLQKRWQVAFFQQRLLLYKYNCELCEFYSCKNGMPERRVKGWWEMDIIPICNGNIQ